MKIFLCGNLINLFIENKIVLFDEKTSIEVLNSILNNEMVFIAMYQEILSLMTLSDETLFDLYVETDEADENMKTRIKEDENSGVKWIELDKIDDYVTEEHMKPIYKLLNKKMKK